jgi:SOS-response transcriptional repressor LexA
MEELTPRQREVLALIRAHIAETGYPPTRADIARSLGFRSANAAEEHLRALARKGVIEISKGTSRGLRLAGGTDEPAARSRKAASVAAALVDDRARGTLPLSRLALHGKPVTAFAWTELLMPLGGRAQQFTIGQNRATVGVALPLSHATKVELAYMNLYNAFPARRANEVNHTLWLSWHYTGERRR